MPTPEAKLVVNILLSTKIQQRLRHAEVKEDGAYMKTAFKIKQEIVVQFCFQAQHLQRVILHLFYFQKKNKPHNNYKDE